MKDIAEKVLIFVLGHALIALLRVLDAVLRRLYNHLGSTLPELSKERLKRVNWIKKDLDN